MKKGGIFWFGVTMFSFLMAHRHRAPLMPRQENCSGWLSSRCAFHRSWHYDSGLSGYAAIGGIYDFLVQYDKKPNKDGTLPLIQRRCLPMLAERWEHNPDMSEWTFFLRKDAKFHSGKPVNAQAVKYTFSRYIKIKNAANTVLWLAKVTEQGMEVADDYTIKFKLQGPNPLLLDYFQMLNLGIQDPEAIEANGGVTPEKPNDWVSKNDVGSGPFKLVSWKPGVEIVLERNENYWGPKAKSKRVVFKIIPEDSTREMLLQRGDIDVMWLPPAKDYEILNKTEKPEGHRSPEHPHDLY